MWNDSYFLSNVEVEEGEEAAFLMNRVIIGRQKDYEVTCDDDVYELCCKTEDMRPIFALVPQTW